MSTDTIVCRTTSWYHKRRIAMLVLIFGFCAYFIYDWKIGYPRKRDAAAAWFKLKDEKGETEADAEYAKIAPAKDWPAEPDKKHDLPHWDWQINVEQPASAAVSGVLGLIMLFFYIRTTRGRLTADADSFSTPDGQHVPFASAFRIDRRKWDHKGLAYVYYKDASGRERRAVIDDLIFGGAAKVLERLQVNFNGEIIDLEKETPAEEKKTDETAEDASAPADKDDSATASTAPAEKE